MSPDRQRDKFSRISIVNKVATRLHLHNPIRASHLIHWSAGKREAEKLAERMLQLPSPSARRNRVREPGGMTGN